MGGMVSMAACMLTAGAAAANLNIGGVIKPMPCKFAMHNGGNLDYGVIPSGQRLQQRDLVLEVKRVRFDVTCEHATRLSLRVTDNHARQVALPPVPVSAPAPVPLQAMGRMPPAAIATLAYRSHVAQQNQAHRPSAQVQDHHQFAITDNDGGAIGMYKVRLAPGSMQGTVDSGEIITAVEVVHAMEGASQWSRRNDDNLRTQGRHAFTASGSTSPAAFSALGGEMVVEAVVSQMTEARSTDEITLQGSATMEIIYD